jgi:hypothetical protein
MTALYKPARKGTWMNDSALPMRVDGMVFYQYRLYVYVGSEWLYMYPDGTNLEFEHVANSVLINSLDKSLRNV